MMNFKDLIKFRIFIVKNDFNKSDQVDENNNNINPLSSTDRVHTPDTLLSYLEVWTFPG